MPGVRIVETERLLPVKVGGLMMYHSLDVSQNRGVCVFTEMFSVYSISLVARQLITKKDDKK
jgi:hypothetical protein